MRIRGEASASVRGGGGAPPPVNEGDVRSDSDPETNVVNKRILVLGGGVAGSSMAYYLTEKGYEVTLIEKNSRVGGLARTCYYSGHPYEFGPHIWFWPGGEEDPV